jgi:uncharacterized protein (DUF1330 family)
MAQENVPAYGLVQIKIKDPEVFNERYSQYVFPILAKAGVEMIAGSTMPATIEGDFDGNWAAVLRFPSLAAAHAWYNSAEYEPFRQMRLHELTESSSLVFIEGSPVTDPVG